MKTYRVKNWPVIDDDGNTYEDGDRVELSDEKAKFYAGRLTEVKPESDNDFDALPDDTEFPYHYGGGNYFLSNGKRISGKQNAIEAEKELSNGNTGNTNGS